MNSPTQALLWSIWRRHRWGLAAGCAYLLLAAVIVRLLPAILRGIPPGMTDLPTIGGYIALPCVFIVVQVIAMFSFISGDFKDSGYSHRMFVLPMTTRTLVAWPMLWGCLAVPAVWWLMAFLILRPTGLDPPLWWPAAALATGMAAFQALSWTPLAQQWLRNFLAVPIFFGLTVAVVIPVALEVPEPAFAVALLVPLPLAWLAAAHAVAMARRGDTYDLRLWTWLVDKTNSWRKPAEHPFRSAAGAQLWFECRGHAWILPAFILAILVCFAGLVISVGRDDVAHSWRLLGAILLLPAFLGGVIGGSLGRQDAWSKFAMTPFLAARPASSAWLVSAKLKMAAISALAAWIPILLFLPLFLLRPGFYDSLVQVIQLAPPWKTAAISALVFAVLIGGTWLCLVLNLWISLCGRAWLNNALPMVFAALVSISGAVGFWIYLHPQWYAAVRATLPALLALFLVAKLVTAAWVLWRIDRQRLIGRPTVAAMIGMWNLVALGLCAIVFGLVPHQFLPVASTIAGLVLWVPFSRLAGAPLALEWNRHR